MKFDYKKKLNYVILKKGEKYYKNSKVQNVMRNDGEVSCVVHGSKNYDVTIYNNDNQNFRFNCSCAYSNNGISVCEHVAALLIYMDNDLVSNVSVDDIKMYIQNSLRTMLNRYGYIDIKHEIVFENLFIHVVSFIDGFLNQKKFDSASEILKSCFSNILNLSFQNYDRIVTDTYQNLFERVKILIADIKYYEDFLNWFLIHNYDEYEPLCSNIIMDLLEEINNKEQVQILNDIISKNASSVKFGNRTYEKVLMLRCKYLGTDGVLDEFYKRLELNPSLENIRILMEISEDEDKLISLLEKYEKNIYRYESAINKLIELYEKRNLKDKQIELLKKTLCNTHNLKYYKTLKTICDKDKWNEIKGDLIKKLRNNESAYVQICKDEKMYDELLDVLRKTMNLALIEDCQKVLLKNHREELLRVYKLAIIKETSSLSTYDTTQYIMNHIKQMDKIKDSEPFVQSLLDSLSIYHDSNYYLFASLRRLVGDLGDKYILKEPDIFEVTFN